MVISFSLSLSLTLSRTHSLTHSLTNSLSMFAFQLTVFTTTHTTNTNTNTTTAPPSSLFYHCFPMLYRGNQGPISAHRGQGSTVLRLLPIHRYAYLSLALSIYLSHSLCSPPTNLCLPPTGDITEADHDQFKAELAAANGDAPVASLNYLAQQKHMLQVRLSLSRSPSLSLSLSLSISLALSLCLPST